MAKGPHVAVIGAGVVGVATTVNLIARGARVALLEARSVATGSSGRSCGMVGTQFTDPFDLELRIHAMRQFRAWRTDLGLSFHPIGYLRLARTSAQMELLERTLPLRTGAGFASRLCGPAEIRALVPDLDATEFAGGSFGPEDGFIDPHQMCSLLVAWLRERGGALRQGSAVEGVDRHGAGWRLATGNGPVEADVVVNAAGAWASQVAEMFGQTLHVRGERHEALEIALDRPLDYIMPMVMDLLNGEGTGLNFRHDGPGRMLTEIHKVDTTAPEDPDGYNDQCEEATKVELAEALLDRLPALTGARLGRGWAGLYPVTADHRPLVGPIDPAEPSVVTAAGAGGYGIQLSPVIGQAAADWAVHGGTPSAPALEALRPMPERNVAV
jgi:sarcosine oxidase subunit beta